MSSFEDHLWSQLVSDHDEQMRQAGEAIAALAAASGESSGRRRRRASSRRPSRRLCVLAGATAGLACVASAIIVAHTATKPTAPTISPAAFTVTNNHDGTLAVALHKRSALPALNLRLARYGLKAKLPTAVPARTLSLTATCPKPTFPVTTHEQAGAPGSGQNQVVHQLPHEPIPTEQQRLTNCVLHVKPGA
jgi:hypothetical protein